MNVYLNVTTIDYDDDDYRLVIMMDGTAFIVHTYDQIGDVIKKVEEKRQKLYGDAMQQKAGYAQLGSSSNQTYDPVPTPLTPAVKNTDDDIPF